MAQLWPVSLHTPPPPPHSCAIGVSWGALPRASWPSVGCGSTAECGGPLQLRPRGGLHPPRHTAHRQSTGLSTGRLDRQRTASHQRKPPLFYSASLLVAGLLVVHGRTVVRRGAFPGNASHMPQHASQIGKTNVTPPTRPCPGPCGDGHEGIRPCHIGGEGTW